MVKVNRICTPEQNAKLILKATKTGRSSIHQMNSQKNLCLKSWWSKYYKKIRIRTKHLQEVFPRRRAYRSKYPRTDNLLSAKLSLENVLGGSLKIDL